MDHLTKYGKVHFQFYGNYFFPWWVIIYDFFLLSTDILNITFFKNILSGITSVSNRLDQDQAQQNIGPDLGPICLQKSSADDKELIKTYVASLSKTSLFSYQHSTV